MTWKNNYFISLLFFSLLATFFLTACGPVQYTAKVLDATAAIESAHMAKAWKLACFEYYASVRYLKKAMEEAGYSDFEAAALFAEKSWKYATLAQKLSRQRSVSHKYPPIICRAPAQILKYYRLKRAPKPVHLEKRIVN